MREEKLLEGIGSELVVVVKDAKEAEGPLGRFDEEEGCEPIDSVEGREFEVEQGGLIFPVGRGKDVPRVSEDGIEPGLGWGIKVTVREDLEDPEFWEETEDGSEEGGN